MFRYLPISREYRNRRTKHRLHVMRSMLFGAVNFLPMFGLSALFHAAEPVVAGSYADICLQLFSVSFVMVCMWIYGPATTIWSDNYVDHKAFGAVCGLSASLTAAVAVFEGHNVFALGVVGLPLVAGVCCGFSWWSLRLRVAQRYSPDLDAYLPHGSDPSYSRSAQGPGGAQLRHSGQTSVASAVATAVRSGFGKRLPKPRQEPEVLNVSARRQRRRPLVTVQIPGAGIIGKTLSLNREEQRGQLYELLRAVGERKGTLMISIEDYLDLYSAASRLIYEANHHKRILASLTEQTPFVEFTGEIIFKTSKNPNLPQTLAD